MAFLRQHHSNCDRGSAVSVCSEARRGGSTSQMCLQKILTVIATVPPPLAAERPLFSASNTKESSPDLGFDLNVGFRVSPEPKGSLGATASGLSSASATAGEGGDPVEISDDHGNGVVHENPHNVEIDKTDGRLILLIEAARLISGEFETENDSVSQGSELKKGELAVEIEANERKLRRRSSRLVAPEIGGEIVETTLSPVVRSKRGRAQVLPGKYRDSVLEPLTRWSNRRRR